MMTEATEDIWADDALGRKADAEFLIDFLLGRIEQRGRQGLPRSYVLNVDAGWGGGKTFFMTRLAKELEQRGHGVAMIDAWEDDHADDPLLSLMSGIEATINPLVKKHPALESTYKVVKKAGLNIAATAAKGALKQAGRKLLGDAADIIAEQVGELAEGVAQKGKDDLSKSLDKAIDKSAEKLLEGFEEGKKSIKDFRKQLGFLIDQIRKEKPDWTLLVLIDELDRCRPTHAIALLERVKHLFNVSNVVFVVATDTAQLSESVKAVYGSGFDGKKYLTRFFDRSYHFPAGSADALIFEILRASYDPDQISLPPEYSLETLAVASAKAFNLSLRQSKRFSEIILDTFSAWKLKGKIESLVMVPLIAGYVSGEIDINKVDAIRSLIPFMNKSDIMKCKFYGLDTFGNRSENIESLGTLIGYFCEEIDNIYDVAARNHHTPVKRWCAQRILDELRTLHNSIVVHDAIKPSIIKNYPQIVGAAGRLHSI